MSYSKSSPEIMVIFAYKYKIIYTFIHLYKISFFTFWHLTRHWQITALYIWQYLWWDISSTCTSVCVLYSMDDYASSTLCNIWHSVIHPAIGVRDQFRLRGLRSVAPNIFSIACLKIKWFFPNITCFSPENGYLKNSRGLQPPPPRPPPPRSPPPCPPPRTPMHLATSNWIL